MENLLSQAVAAFPAMLRIGNEMAYLTYEETKQLQDRVSGIVDGIDGRMAFQYGLSLAAAEKVQ